MITQSQLNKIKSIRTLFRFTPCTLWTVTKTGAASTDFYRRAVSIYSGARLFSGSVAWMNYIYRRDASGGFYKTSDVTIVCSLDEKTRLDTNNSYLVCETVPLRMKTMVQATDTEELVIYCERLNE